RGGPITSAIVEIDNTCSSSSGSASLGPPCLQGSNTEVTEMLRALRVEGLMASEYTEPAPDRLCQPSILVAALLRVAWAFRPQEDKVLGRWRLDDPRSVVLDNLKHGHESALIEMQHHTNIRSVGIFDDPIGH